MSIKITLIVIALMGWLGTSIHTPICSLDDRRYVEYFGIEEECENEQKDK